MNRNLLAKKQLHNRIKNKVRVPSDKDGHEHRAACSAFFNHWENKQTSPAATLKDDYRITWEKHCAHNQISRSGETTKTQHD
jgi:hypothetical protein